MFSITVLAWLFHTDLVDFRYELHCVVLGFRAEPFHVPHPACEVEREQIFEAD